MLTEARASAVSSPRGSWAETDLHEAAELSWREPAHVTLQPHASVRPPGRGLGDPGAFPPLAWAEAAPSLAASGNPQATLVPPSVLQMTPPSVRGSPRKTSSASRPQPQLCKRESYTCWVSTARGPGLGPLLGAQELLPDPLPPARPTWVAVSEQPHVPLSYHVCQMGHSLREGGAGCCPTPASPCLSLAPSVITPAFPTALPSAFLALPCPSWSSGDLAPGCSCCRLRLGWFSWAPPHLSCRDSGLLVFCASGGSLPRRPCGGLLFSMTHTWVFGRGVPFGEALLAAVSPLCYSREPITALRLAGSDHLGCQAQSQQKQASVPT